MQDSIEKVDHALMSDKELDQTLQVHLYNSKGNDNTMARKAFGTSTLYTRPQVLRKWFALLKQMCDGYDINNATINCVVGQVQENVMRQQQDLVFVTDKDSLEFEKGLGSDVAQAVRIWIILWFESPYYGLTLLV